MGTVKVNTTPPEKKRAPKGSTTVRMLLALEPELDLVARQCAAREGCSLSEWWRRAGRERVAQQMFPNGAKA